MKRLGLAVALTAACGACSGHDRPPPIDESFGIGDGGFRFPEVDAGSSGNGTPANAKIVTLDPDEMYIVWHLDGRSDYAAQALLSDPGEYRVGFHRHSRQFVVNPHNGRLMYALNDAIYSFVEDPNQGATGDPYEWDLYPSDPSGNDSRFNPPTCNSTATVGFVLAADTGEIIYNCKRDCTSGCEYYRENGDALDTQGADRLHAAGFDDHFLVTKGETVQVLDTVNETLESVALPAGAQVRTVRSVPDGFVLAITTSISQRGKPARQVFVEFDGTTTNEGNFGALPPDIALEYVPDCAYDAAFTLFCTVTDVPLVERVFSFTAVGDPGDLVWREGDGSLLEWSADVSVLVTGP